MSRDCDRKNGIKHRADICIGSNIIEFQHSPLSSEEFEKRNEFYTNCGYHVVWVFDADGKIKNPYDDDNILDPAKSWSNEFVWKREKETFSGKINDNVEIYLEYKTTLCLKEKGFENSTFDIMLPIVKMSPRLFEFYTTEFYIQQNNFLKEFGVYKGDDSLSLSEIFNQSRVFRKRNNYIGYPCKTISF